MRAARSLAMLSVAWTCACGGASARRGAGVEAPSRDVDLDALIDEDVRGTAVPDATFADAPVVLVSFWATWCEPCKDDLDLLAELRTIHGESGLQAVAVSLDEADFAEQVRSYAERRSLRLVVVHDVDRRVAAALNPRHHLPYTVVVARGRILEAFARISDVGRPEIDEKIESLLAETGR